VSANEMWAKAATIACIERVANAAKPEAAELRKEGTGVTAVDVFIPGKAAPQGSKRHVGRGILVESSKDVKPWRESIRWALLAMPAPARASWPLQGPIWVQLEFVLPRPKSTPKRTTPPAVKRPDLDKLQRAVLDAVGSAGVWGDDAQVVEIHARKRLAEIGEVPGCQVRIAVAVAQEVAA
jgi:crossover junction endodeoxyribonuclease RusA